MIDLVVAAGAAIILSAACSVTEAALYAIPWSHIELLRKEGASSGLLLFKLRTDIDKPITAVLTLNTLANTAGAAIAGAAAVREFGSENMGYFATFFTVAILLFSEILPKTIGVAYARQLAPLLAKPLAFTVKAFSPIIWITGSLAKLVRPETSGPQTTEEDIQAMVSLTRRSGEILPYEESLIRNILALDNKCVEEIMTPRTVVFSLPTGMTTQEARTAKDFWHYSRIPVYEGDETEDIVGIVYRRDVLNALANDQDDLPLSQLMRPVRFVTETLSLDRLLPKFLQSRVHLYVVLDEYGGVAGVVSLEDLMEEMLGKEIVDETDEFEDMRELARRQRERLTKE